jgi:hypothetical protein
MIDRFGEETDDPDEGVRRPHTLHDPRCRNGWIGDDEDGRPIPCRTCKPHLSTTARVDDCAPESTR